MVETCCDQMRVMCSLLHVYRNLIFGKHHMAGSVDEVAKDVLRFGDLVAGSQPGSQQPIKTACHHREQHITVDFHRYRRG